MTNGTSDQKDKKSSSNIKPKDSCTIPEGYVYRDQKRRYPWWVKSVDKITTPTDDSISKRKTTDQIMMSMTTQRDENVRRGETGRKRLIERIMNKAPGSSLRDLALHYASMTYFAGGVSMFTGGFITEFLTIKKAISKLIHPPDELGVPRWEGTEGEASEMVEAAAIHLGAAQVGFTALNPQWLEASIEISPEVEKIRTTEDGRVLVPESLKYVIVLIGLVPMAAQRRAPSSIGDAADRSGYENRQMIMERVINFIKGLGYRASYLPGFVPNTIPFALMAGLGEMGRMNRLISPLYGGAIRPEAIVTDLPLALDKPIDFGLQEFCKRCKKCARACPANAISYDDEPSWEPPGPYSVPGKKVWYDNCERCINFSSSNNLYCGACLGACTWNKDNKTYLHTIARIMGARVPNTARFLVFMDDLFGYGLVPEHKRDQWWKLKLPIKGIDSSRK